MATERYNGWKLYKKVVIIEEALVDSRGEKCEAPRAYIADAADKRQIETGRRWAKATVYEDSGYVEKNGKEYTFDNAGFVLELSSSPSDRWRGGKLSFCMCTIKKDGHSWTTGINSDLLIDLLKQSDCLHGVVQGNIAFARKNGNVGMVRIGSESHKEALNDDEYRKKASRTTKAKLGYAHNALYESNTWLFDINQWFKFSKAEVNREYSYGARAAIGTKRIRVLEILDTPTKRHIFPANYVLKRYIDEEDKDKCIGDIIANSVEKELLKRNTTRWNQFMSIPIIDYKYDLGFGVARFPARAVGDKIISPEITEEQFSEFVKKLVEQLEIVDNNIRGRNYNYFSEESLALVLGVTLGKDREKLPSIEDAKRWVKDACMEIIVKYDGETIMSDKLKAKLSTKEYWGLKYVEDDKAR